MYPLHSLDHSLLWSILAVTSNIGSIASTSLMYHTKSLTTVASLLARFGMACVVGFYVFFPTTKNEEMEQKSEDASSGDSSCDKSSSSTPWKRELICLILCYITQFLVRSIYQSCYQPITHRSISLVVLLQNGHLSTFLPYSPSPPKSHPLFSHTVPIYLRLPVLSLFFFMVSILSLHSFIYLFIHHK